MDAKLHSVSSSNIDGSDSRIVLYSHRYLNHPFSITVFEVSDVLICEDFFTQNFVDTFLLFRT